MSVIRTSMNKVTLAAGQEPKVKQEVKAEVKSKSSQKRVSTPKDSLKSGSGKKVPKREEVDKLDSESNSED